MRGTIKQRLILLITALAILFTVLPTMAIADDANGNLEILTPSRLPNATINTPYTTQIIAEGGQPPYKFVILNPNYVPKGMTISDDGIIKVTPVTGGVTYSDIEIRVTDDAGATADKKFSLPISARRLNFQMSENVFTYDGNPHFIDDIKPFYGSEDMSGTIDYEVTYGESTSQINAGTYPININVKTPGYMVRSMDKTHMIINKSSNVNISFDDNVFFTYEKDQQRTPGVSVQGRPTESDEWVDLDYTRLYEGITVDYSSSTPPSEPGVYRLSCTVNNANYETPANNSINFEIQREVVNFTLNDQSPFYLGDEWNRTYEPSVEGFTDYTVEYVKDGVEHETPTVSSGTYAVKITLGKDSRYQVGTITPSEFKVERTQADFVMDPASYEYTGSAIHPVITNSLGLVEGTDYELKYIDSNGQEIQNPTNVGEYTVSIKNLKDSEDNDNPELNGFKVSPEKFKITPKRILFTVDNASWVYDNTEHTPEFTLSDTGINKDLYTVKYVKKEGDETELETVKDAGEYEIHIAFTDENGNYIVDKSSSDTITVSQQEVSFTIDPDEFPYDGNHHKTTLNTENTITTDDYTVQYRKDDELTEDVVNAGEYDVVVTITNDNYSLSDNVVGRVNVIPRELTFEVSDNTVPYDANPHQATITPSVPTLALNTDYTVKYKDKNNNLTESVIEAGEYDIVINVINTNYSYAAQSFKMNITTTVKWNIGNSPAAMIYKDINHANDEEWQQAALNELRTNRSFSNFVPAQCEAGINYYRISDDFIDFDLDENTIIVNNLSGFKDPGIVINGRTVYAEGNPEEVDGDTLYKLSYEAEGTEYIRYIAVIGKIGDVNNNGSVNAIDANYLDTKNVAPKNIAEARVWDVNKDGNLDRGDATDIRNRFKVSLKPYYPWIED